MILTLFSQVLQELNVILLIVAPLLAPLGLILVHRVIKTHAHSFPFVFFLRSKILPLLVVLSHVDAINTTIVALDPLFLLDTHSYELLECPLFIHGIVVHLEGLKFLQERVEIQINQETILDSQIKGLQSSSNIAHSHNMISHTTDGLLLINEPPDESACICL
jgi:hypothetical protein